LVGYCKCDRPKENTKNLDVEKAKKSKAEKSEVGLQLQLKHYKAMKRKSFKELLLRAKV